MRHSHPNAPHWIDRELDPRPVPYGIPLATLAQTVPDRPNTRTDPARSKRRHLVAIAVLVGMAGVLVGFLVTR